MKSILMFIILYLTLQLSTVLSYDGAQKEEKIPKQQVFTSINVFEINQKKYIAISLKHHPHWHTYWINPGDAGLPAKASFTADGKKLELPLVEWPAPIRFISPGNILSYGFKRDYSLFYSLPDQHSNTIALDLQWLACKNICIPGKANYILSFKNGHTSIGPSSDFSVDDQELKTRFLSLPKTITIPKNLKITLHKGSKENQLALIYTIDHTAQAVPDSARNIITPFPHHLLDFQKESFSHQDNTINAKMFIDWDGEYTDPVVPFPKAGKLSQPITVKFLYNDPATQKPYIIKKEFNSIESTIIKPSPASIPFGKKPQTKEKEQNPNKPSSSKTSTSFFLYLIMAFIGGLILNIMPCVLPVISIKLFGLLQHSHDSKKLIFKHNLFYTLGVLFTFLILSLIVIIIKNTGESIGWGFQLQSPKFVAAMIVVIFIFSLNMFGLFEFNTPGGRQLGSVNLKDGIIGDFLGGVLATILSTPCSAPFLGTALTFAFSSPSYIVISIFLSIGIGLSFPFILTGFFPKLISFLPRPGMWMEGVKKFLGLTLLITVIWLLDVFNAQVDSSLYNLKLSVALAFIFFYFYMKKSIIKKKSTAYAILLLPLIIFVQIFFQPITQSDSDIPSSMTKNNLRWEKWSESKMSEYRSSNDLVFIDFTAKWCLTCKVNEKLVLETSSFRKLVKENNIKLLLGDWTKRDPVIGNWLKENGSVGVPAYFIQKKTGELIPLGETISLKKIKKHL